MSVAILPFPTPSPRPVRSDGASAFFRTLVGELRAAPLAASPKNSNDNDKKSHPQFA